MLPNITLSIRDKEMPLWDYARRYADEHYTSLSGLATMALTEHLGKRGAPERITVKAQVDGEVRTVSFIGHWLVEPGDKTPGIALTAKNRIAVYTTNGHIGLLDHYDTLDEAQQARPLIKNDDVWAKARSARKPVIELDI